MKNELRDKILHYVEERIGEFHEKRINSLKLLRLNNVIKRKNPYLFKAKYLLTSEKIIKGFVDAHISSNEETLFGDWLEGFAIFINENVYGGRKSGIAGIDLEFDKDGYRYIVSIKSGPNWGNSSQIKKMKGDFTAAKKTLRTSGSNLNIAAVNGCCYGVDNKPDKGDYFKYCGQRFWEFISGEEELYLEIIEPLGHRARERNSSFDESYAQVINKFVTEFSKNFCCKDGKINWEKLVKLNSQKTNKK